MTERETSQVLAKSFAELRLQGTSRGDVARALHLPQRELEGLLFGLTISVVEGQQGPRSPEHGRPHLKLVD